MPKITTLEPDFRSNVEQLLAILPSVTGRTWVVTSGRRTMAEQQHLYNQGRTEPGKVVTNARPGSSAHNFGLAADLAPLKADGSAIDWNAPRHVWQVMADTAQQMGLVAGFYFHSIVDMPHVESPTWKAAQADWKAGKLVVA